MFALLKDILLMASVFEKYVELSKIYSKNRYALVYMACQGSIVWTLAYWQQCFFFTMSVFKGHTFIICPKVYFSWKSGPTKLRWMVLRIFHACEHVCMYVPALLSSGKFYYFAYGNIHNRGYLRFYFFLLVYNLKISCTRTCFMLP